MWRFRGATLQGLPGSAVSTAMRRYLPYSAANAIVGAPRGRRRLLAIDPVTMILGTTPLSLWVGSLGVSGPDSGVTAWASQTGTGVLTTVHGTLTRAVDAAFSGLPVLSFAGSGMVLDLVRADAAFSLLTVFAFPNLINSYSGLGTVGYANIFATGSGVNTVPSNEYNLSNNIPSNTRRSVMISQAAAGLPTARVNGVSAGVGQRYVTSFTRGLGIPVTASTYLTGRVALMGYWTRQLSAKDIATVAAAVLTLTGATV